MPVTKPNTSENTYYVTCYATSYVLYKNNYILAFSSSGKFLDLLLKRPRGAYPVGYCLFDKWISRIRSDADVKGRISGASLCKTIYDLETVGRPGSGFLRLYPF